MGNTLLRIYLPIAGFLICSGPAQVNFGTFSLNRNAAGDFEVGLNQMANILGFGGDRSLTLTTGNGKFAARTNEGARIGGERLGVDSGIDIKEGQALNLGSTLNFGNNPSLSANPTGQLGDFVTNIGKFFESLSKPTIPPPLIPSSPAAHNSLLGAGSMEKKTTAAFLPSGGGSFDVEEGELKEEEDVGKLNSSRITTEGRILTESQKETSLEDGSKESSKSVIVEPPVLPGLVEIDKEAEDKPDISKLRRFF